MDKSQSRWLILAQGIIGILFGIVIILWPIKTLIAITWLLGAFFLIEAVLFLITSFFHKGNFFHSLIQALIFGFFSLLVLNYPEETLKVLVFLFALWAILSGIVQTAGSLKLHDDKEYAHLMLFGGIFSLGVGILLFVFPVATVGISQIIFGVTLLVTGVGTTLHSFKIK